MEYKTIEDLNLTVRTTICLKSAGIITVEQLLQLSEEDLKKIKNLAGKNIQEILDAKAIILEGCYVSGDDLSKIKDVDYSNVPVEALNLSGRASNALKRARVLFVDQFLLLSADSIMSLPGIGAGSRQELIDKQRNLAEGKVQVYETNLPKNKEEYKNIPITEIDIPNRAFNALQRNGIINFYDLVEIAKTGFQGIRNLGEITINATKQAIIDFDVTDYYLKEAIMNLGAEKETDNFEKEIECSNNYVSDSIRSRPVKDLLVSKRIKNVLSEANIQTIGELIDIDVYELGDRENFGRTSLQELVLHLKRLKRQGEGYFEARYRLEGNIGKSGRDFDLPILEKLKTEFHFDYNILQRWFGISRQRVHQKLQRQISYDKWTGKMLSDDERQIIIRLIQEKRFSDLSSESEIMVLNNRKDDCVFIFVNPTEIKCFFMNDLPKEIIEMIRAAGMDRYGETEISVVSNAKELEMSMTRYIEQRIDEYNLLNVENTEPVGVQIIAEPDMLVNREKDTKSVQKIFAENPLLGSRILDDSFKSKLYEYTRNYLDKCNKDSQIKLPIEAKMQITLAVINYTKDWDTSDESQYWKHITTQFGFRDTTGKIANILRDCVKESLEKNNRFIIKTDKGYQYKSSVVVHALSTKTTWMKLFDFLFDFYKSNLNWTYREGDPAIHRMVISLKNKLSASDELGEDDIHISSKVFQFREGVRKIFLFRPMYATILFSKLIKRIDQHINHNITKPKTYEDLLCDEWMELKLREAQKERKERKTHKSRDIAYDYTRIKASYQIEDEDRVVISIPDVRLEDNEFNTLELRVYFGDDVIESEHLEYYGNELGKTLIGTSVDLGKLLKKSRTNEICPEVRIYCDDKIIYNSEKSLYREYIILAQKNEISTDRVGKGNYIIFSSGNRRFEFINTDESLLMESDCYKIYFAAPEEGFIIRCNDEIICMDGGQDGKTRVIPPAVIRNVIYRENEEVYEFVDCSKEFLIALPDENTKQFIRVIINDNDLNLDDFESYTDSRGVIYKIPVSNIGEERFMFTCFDFKSEKVIFTRKYTLKSEFNYSFSKKYFFIDSDYENAYVSFELDGEKRTVDLEESSYVWIPYRNGVIEVSCPIIKVFDNNGNQWSGNKKEWVGNISQDVFLNIANNSNCYAHLYLNKTEINSENSGAFSLGNALISYEKQPTEEWIDLYLKVTDKSGNEYGTSLIGSFALKEQFIETPELSYRDRMLLWDRGYGFIGNPGKRFIVELINAETSEVLSFSANSDDLIIAENVDIPTGEYDYIISAESENIFVSEKEEIASGNFIAGDINEIRFNNRQISVNIISLEEDDTHFVIQPSYIDGITYIGTEYVDSEDCDCPIYSGTMFYYGTGGVRRDYSNSYNDENGTYMINPVRIIYINEKVIGLSNDDGDGFYFYRRFDKYKMENKYFLTDREPTKVNEKDYNLGDLYIYSVEEI